MLKQRIITALLIGLPVIAALLLLPNQIMILLFAVVVLLAGWEWSALVQLRSRTARVAYLAVLICCMGLSWLYVRANEQLQLFLGCVLLWWLVALMWILIRPLSVSQTLAALAGLLVLAPAWLTLTLLQTHLGPQWVLFLVVMVVFADIGGFMFGRKFGHSKLAPQVSPGKTWEGVAGGLLLSMVVALVGSRWLVMPGVSFMLLCLLTVMVSVVGDLTESLFKRHAGLKDSGSLLPGHGGVLDRIDSISAAAPVFLAGLIYLGVFAA